MCCTAGPKDRPYDEEHGDTCVSLVKRGVFAYRSGGQLSILSPGWLLLGNAGEPYVCSHEHGQGDECIVLSFSEHTIDLVRSAVGECGGRKPFRLARLPPLPRVSALMRLLEEGSRSCDLDLSEAAFGVADAVLRELTRLGPSRGPVASPSCRRAEKERVHEAVNHIEAHAADPLSLNDIAASVDLSPFHFLRVFRQELGVTPHQYLIRARLRRAVDLLRDTPLSVTEVAYEAGYADLSNFVRTFHREIGCSPREFRRCPPGRGSKILQDRSP